MYRPTKMITINGKQRPITLYSEKDIKDQRALLNTFQAVIADNTHRCACAYVPGKSTICTVENAFRAMASYKYYIKTDIINFFPSISRYLLAKRIKKVFGDSVGQSILNYICCSPSGIAEGSPLSPAISNLYLYDLDNQLESLYDVFYLRYGDDILIFSNIEPQVLFKIISKAVSEQRLKLNLNKTRIGSTTRGVEFLGHFITPSKLQVTKKSVRKLVLRIKAEKHKRRQKMIINGWWAYCKNANRLPDIKESIFLLMQSGFFSSAWKMAKRMYRSSPPLRQNEHGQHSKNRQNSRWMKQRAAISSLTLLINSVFTLR